MLFKDFLACRMTNMTQEIGYIEPRTGEMKYDDFPVGSMLMLYPYHVSIKSLKCKCLIRSNVKMYLFMQKIPFM